MKSDAIIGAVNGVTKKWAKQRKAEERKASSESNRAYLWRSYRETIKDVAFEVMENAYLKASGGGKLPAQARQIMYAARGAIQERTGKPLGDQYFCQTLLPDYMEYYSSRTASWDVVFDARGHFTEPHTKHSFGLGTIGVRRYLGDAGGPSFVPARIAVHDSKIETLGPDHRYGAILFIEKEGFMPLFEAVNLAKRYDIAIMSTKGMSNTASRRLIDDLCSAHDMPLLVLHDFDKAGFSILGTLKRSTRRYAFKHHIKVVDLGIRLADIEQYDLESEDAYIRGKVFAARRNLRMNGATEEEIEFLLKHRVELNAFASDDLIAWIEAKLGEHGVEKVIPDTESLEEVYLQAVEAESLRREFAKREEEKGEAVATPDIPADLHQQVSDLLTDNPELSWDLAIADIASEANDTEDAA